MNKLIIAGSRGIIDEDLILVCIEKYLEEFEHTFNNDINGEYDLEIISGKASGVDTVSADICTRQGYPVTYYPANWSKYGKRAGPLRNEEMARAATHCLVIWDGKSKGSLDMYKRAVQLKLYTRLYNTDTGEITDYYKNQELFKPKKDGKV